MVFLLTFVPVVGTKVKSQDGAVCSTEERLMALKILVVEDESVMRDIYRLVLGQYGTIIEAENHDETRAQLKENPDVSVIIMDGVIKSGDTISLIIEICESGFSGDIIACSGQSQEYIDQMMRAGCSANWPKPAKRSVMEAFFTSRAR